MDYFAGLDVSVKETSICIVDDSVDLSLTQGVATPLDQMVSALGNPRGIVLVIAMGSGQTGVAEVPRDQKMRDALWRRPMLQPRLGQFHGPALAREARSASIDAVSVPEPLLYANFAFESIGVRAPNVERMQRRVIAQHLRVPCSERQVTRPRRYEARGIRENMRQC